jgi:hypothetical protein
MVNKNLTVDYKFNVLTSSKYHGWWSKLEMLSKATGPCLYFDLDTVITGNIDYLVDYTKNKLSAPANWGQSGHGGVQSSVMAWNGSLQEIEKLFNYDVDSNRLWGDQEFLTEVYGDSYVKLPYIYSYKYHCANKLHEGAKIVCFHGKPDYWEVSDTWVKSALS